VQLLSGQSDDAFRRRHHRHLLASTLLAAPAFAALLTTAGCGGGSSAFGGGAADTAFVGVAVGLTSVERYVDVFSGVQLALDQLNKQRTGNMPVLALRRAPTAAKTVIAVAVAFRDDPKVIGVVGHTESGPTIAAGAIYADREHNGEHALVAVSPTAGAQAVTSSEWVFRVCPNTSEQAHTVARYAADSLSLRRVGVLYRNEASGKESMRAFGDEFSKRGGKVTERDPFTEDIPDFDAYGRRLTKTGADGVVVASGNAPEERAIIHALRAAGGHPVVLGWNPPENTDSATINDFRGMRYVMLYSATRSPTPESVRFAADFRAKTGKTPDKWGALGYDAAMLIGLASQSVGPNRQKIRGWLAGVGREHPAYAGVTGSIAFDDHRDPVNKRVLIGEVGR